MLETESLSNGVRLASSLIGLAGLDLASDSPFLPSAVLRLRSLFLGATSLAATDSLLVVLLSTLLLLPALLSVGDTFGMVLPATEESLSLLVGLSTPPLPDLFRSLVA